MSEKNISAEQALTSLFRQTKAEANTNISVATLAVVESVVTSYNNVYGTANVRPIPRWDKDGTNGIEGYFFSSDVAAGDVVLVVFTDYDFRTAVKTQNFNPVETVNKNTHSKNFGIIISLIKGDKINGDE